MKPTLFITEDGVKITNPKQLVFMVERGSFSNNYKPFDAETAQKCGWGYKFSTRRSSNIFALKKKLERAQNLVRSLAAELAKY